jgi:hypothetical protein
MNDSEAIRTAAETLFQMERKQQFSDLDPLPLQSLVTPDFYSFVVSDFAKSKTAGLYFRAGAVNEHSLRRLTKVTSTTATIIDCDRNDAYTWDSKMTDDPSDDVRSGGKPRTFESLVTLKKEGGKWLVADHVEQDLQYC